MVMVWSSATYWARQVGELMLDAMRDADHALGRGDVSSGDSPAPTTRRGSEDLRRFLDAEAKGRGGGGQPQAVDQGPDTSGAHALADGSRGSGQQCGDQTPDDRYGRDTERGPLKVPADRRPGLARRSGSAGLPEGPDDRRYAR